MESFATCLNRAKMDSSDGGAMVGAAAGRRRRGRRDMAEWGKREARVRGFLLVTARGELCPPGRCDATRGSAAGRGKDSKAPVTGKLPSAI